MWNPIIPKALDALRNVYADKDHGVWVGTRGLGSKFTPQLGPLHHAAIWVDGTLIEVSGKEANNKIILNIEYEVKIQLGITPFDKFNWKKVASESKKSLEEIIDYAQNIADCQYSVMPKSHQHNCQTFVREMLKFILGNESYNKLESLVSLLFG